MIGDLFSKYIEIVPIKSQIAQSIVEAVIDNWIFRYGCPVFMLSDQASNVDGELLQEVCALLNIKKRRSSAYHSRGNGFAERNILKMREVSVQFY